MKHRATYWGTALTGALLCLCMMAGALLPAVANEPLPSLDYGIPGREDNTTYSTVDLYEQLFGTQPTAAETTYLGTTGITFSYNSNVPNSLLTTEYDSEAGLLSVTILPYTYTASNGETVTWLPTVATIDGEQMTLTEENGIYYCKLENLFYSEDFDMQVEYAWSVDIPVEIQEELRNTAYTLGSAGLDRFAAYEEELAAYRDAMTRYEDWQAYLAWKEIYDAYLLELAAYRAAKEAYENYCREYAKYEDELERYELWQDYYNNAPTEEEILAYNKYKKYLSDMKIVTAMLPLMESLFVADSNGWQMYGSIMGGSVLKVLTNEDLLVNTLGYDEAYIRLAGDATDVLRGNKEKNLPGLLPEYDKLRKATYASEYERVKALYGFYQNHYEELKEQFTNLHNVLYRFAGDPVVVPVIKGYGKWDHYLQFVGQLYVISSCLNGSRDKNWSIYNGDRGTFSLSEVVESVHMFPAAGWNPTSYPMPEEAPPADPVVSIDPPTVEQPAKKPVKPEPVPNPGNAPVAPENPYENGIPAEAEHPGTAPTAPVLDAMTSALMEEIRTGVLKQYTGTFQPVTFSFTSVVNKKVSIKNLKTVSFYDAHGNFLESFQLNYGESVNYPLPELESTAQYHYTPRGWISIDGSSVDLVSVKSDLALMPSYSKTLRSYTVTWIFNGETVSESRYYDETSIPTPPAKWSLADKTQGHYNYTFSGWDSEVKPVTGDATYRGEMIKTLRNYTVTWVLYGDKVITEEWQALSTPVFTGDTARPSDSRTYRFIGWKGPVGVLQGDTVYTAQYETTKLAVGNSGVVMDVVHSDEMIQVHATVPSLDVSSAADLAIAEGKTLNVVWDNGFSLSLCGEDLRAFDASNCRHIVLQRSTDGNAVCYALNFYNSAWKKLDQMGEGVVITLPYERLEDRETVFLVMGEDGWERWEERTIRVKGSAEIRQVYSYAISVAPNKQCNTLSMQEQAVAGDRVSLKLKCVFGYEVSGATVLDANGKEIPVDKDLTFVMPEGAVSITLDVTQIKYTVTFIVDGKVVSSAEYALNEEIKIPDAPTLPPHDGYIYTFISWGDVPAVAVGSERDLVFEAQFSRAPEYVEYRLEGGGSVLFEVILPLVGVGILLLIAGLITWRVLRKRKKKAMAATQATVQVDDRKDTSDEEISE